MTERIKNIFSFLFRLSLSVLLLWFIFRKIDIPKTVDVLKAAQMEYIIYGGLVFLLTNAVLIARWFIFIRALNLPSPAFDVVRYFFAGLFGNLFLPSAIGGDIIKIIGLCQKSSHKPRVVASVVLDRLSGFAAISLVAVVAFIFGYRYINEISLIVPIALMGLGVLFIAILLFNSKAYAFGCRLFGAVPKFKNSLMQMHEDIMYLKDRKMEGYKAIGLSCLGQVIFAFCYYLVAKALHQDIGIIYFLIFVPMICIASSFPSIGGLGVREAGAAYLFSKIGVESGIAVSISLINFLFMVIVGVLGGAVYAVTTMASKRGL